MKWDMNRHLTDLGSAYLEKKKQGELSHRYVLGLYSILEELTERFPKVLFESCSSGGGRFDAGMLYYMPQTWASDNTDAVCRLKIQHGTSILFPAITMGAHVSAVPNHQVGRVTALETRYAVAAAGNLGYELDFKKLSQGEMEVIKKQIASIKDSAEQFNSESITDWQIRLKKIKLLGILFRKMEHKLFSYIFRFWQDRHTEFRYCD